MPGRKTQYDATYLTRRAVYRSAVAAPDASPDLEGIPDIRLDIDASALIQNPAAGVPNCYAASRLAYNGRLEAYIHFTIGPGVVCIPSTNMIINGVLEPTDSRCHATLQFWVESEPQDGGTVDPEWCLVHEQSVVASTLIRLKDLPAAIYRITVANISADCSVDILEQHTE